jgi:hypothetical protein
MTIERGTGMLPLAEAVIRIEMHVMYSAVYLEKFALTGTAGYSACFYMLYTTDCQLASRAASILTPAH